MTPPFTAFTFIIYKNRINSTYFHKVTTRCCQKWKEDFTGQNFGCKIVFEQASAG